MQKSHTPKNGAGASLSRRNFMSIAAAGTAATLPAVAIAGASEKTSRLPQQTIEPEHPWETVRRLANELSEALNDADEGRWFAKIYPSDDAEYHRFPIYFGDISADERWRRQPSHGLMRLIDEHRKAYDELSLASDEDGKQRAGCYSTTEPGQRWRDADAAEAKAFNAVLSYEPPNSVTWGAKADFIRQFSAGCVLDEDQIALLLNSMGGSVVV